VSPKGEEVWTGEEEVPLQAVNVPPTRVIKDFFTHQAEVDGDIPERSTRDVV